ncbi:hypothetical protein AAMO2058_000158400 [Amorphochlora amoebiformis]
MNRLDMEIEGKDPLPVSEGKHRGEGKEDKKKALEDIEKCVWNPIQANGECPPSSSGMSCVEFEGFIYVFGGFGGYSRQQAIDTMHRYDTRTNTWAAIKTYGESPRARTSHSMVLDEEKGIIYVMLGSGSRFGYSNYDDIFAYSILYRRWTPITLCPSTTITGRYGHASVFHKNKIYIFGGCFGRSLSNDMFVVDVKKRTAIKIKASREQSPTPCARYKHCMVKVAKRECQHKMIGRKRSNRKEDQQVVLVMYGGCSERQAMNDTWVFDPKTQKWTEITNSANLDTVPRRCFAHVMVNISGRLLTHGGTDAWTILQDTYQLDARNCDISKWRWKRVDDVGYPPAPRYFHVMSGLSESLIVWGGKGSITQPLRFNDLYIAKLRTPAQPHTPRSHSHLLKSPQTHPCSHFESQSSSFSTSPLDLDEKYSPAPLFATSKQEEGRNYGEGLRGSGRGLWEEEKGMRFFHDREATSSSLLPLLRSVLQRDMLEVLRSPVSYDLEIYAHQVRDLDWMGDSKLLRGIPCHSDILGIRAPKLMEKCREHPSRPKKTIYGQEVRCLVFPGNRRILQACLFYAYTDQLRIVDDLGFLVEVAIWAITLGLTRLAALARQRVVLAIRSGQADLLHPLVLSALPWLENQDLDPESKEILDVLEKFLEFTSLVETDQTSKYIYQNDDKGDGGINTHLQSVNPASPAEYKTHKRQRTIHGASSVLSPGSLSSCMSPVSGNPKTYSSAPLTHISKQSESQYWSYAPSKSFPRKRFSVPQMPDIQRIPPSRLSDDLLQLRRQTSPKGFGILRLHLSKSIEVCAHKYILAARSEFFGCFSFISGMAEARSGSCDLTRSPFGVKALDIMLEYIYGGPEAVVRYCLQNAKSSKQKREIFQALRNMVSMDISDYFGVHPEIAILCRRILYEGDNELQYPRSSCSVM